MSTVLEISQRFNITHRQIIVFLNDTWKSNYSRAPETVKVTIPTKTIYEPFHHSDLCL